MSALTTKQVRALLIGALAPALKTATPAGPISSVLPFAGQIRASGHVELESLGNTPCVLVGLDREQFGNATITDQDTLLETGSVGGDGLWMCLVAFPLARAKSLQVAADLLDDCVDAVTSALNGYQHPGLLNGAVRLVDSYPFPANAAVVLHVVRVRVMRGVDARDNSDATDPALGQADLDFNVVPETGDNTNPAAKGRVEFE